MIHLKMSHTLFLTPFNVSSSFAPNFAIKIPNSRRMLTKIRCSNADNSQNQQQLNLSVLRFTLGIPGLDESYLPRWIGYAFGSLLVLNHFVGSSSTYITPAQLRTEVLGLSLAAFSVMLPYLGQFLKGASPVLQASIPEGAEQIFAMSGNISDTIKEDLAWGSYTLLRNTNSISVATANPTFISKAIHNSIALQPRMPFFRPPLISMNDALCVRGYWNTPKIADLSKDKVVEWFKEQIQQIGLYNLTDTLYFPQRSDSELWEILPEGTRSLLVLPVLQSPNEAGNNSKEKIVGFVLLASSISYAYSSKDRAWITAIANKF